MVEAEGQAAGVRRLGLGGKVTEIGEPQYLSLVRNLAQGYCGGAEAYNESEASGFPDWRDAFQLPEVGQTEFAKAIADQIDDSELADSFGSLRSRLQELVELDRRMVDWLAQLVGLPQPRSKRDKTRLNRRLHKVVVNGPDGRPQGPVWAMQPEYQAFVRESGELLAGVRAMQDRVDRRIDYLLKGTVT